MNKFRKKQINAVINKLESLYDIISDYYYELDNIYQDELQYLEDIPENMQSGDWFDEKEEKCDTLGDILYDLNELNESLSNIKERLSDLY